MAERVAVAKLCDLLSTTKDGDWGKDAPETGKVPYRVIRGADFPHARSGDTTSIPRCYLSEDAVRRRTLEADDILIETAGGNRDRPTGRTFLVTERLLKSLDLPATCASFCRFLRVNPHLAQPRYVYWYLQYLYHRGDMWEHQVQHTGVARFQYTKFAQSVDIPLLRRSVQCAIAHILGTLDHKIELNRRMNETLEAMARAIFKSWFVDFDPVRAKAEGRNPGLPKPIAHLFPDSFEDSELGEIPKGWRVGTLGEVIEIHDSKRIPLSSRDREQRRGPYRYYGAAGVIDYVDDFLFDDVYVLVGEDGSVVTDAGNPVVQYVWGKFWVNNHAHVLKGVGGVSDEQLFLLLKQVYVVPFATGAVQPKLSQTNMKAIPLLLSTAPLTEAFGRTAEPLFAAIRALHDENLVLAELRDTLLPKLLSGEIRVADGDKPVEKML